jgi:hypothetical protein
LYAITKPASAVKKIQVGIVRPQKKKDFETNGSYKPIYQNFKSEYTEIDRWN